MPKSITQTDIKVRKRKKDDINMLRMKKDDFVIDMIQQTLKNKIEWVSFGALLEYIKEEGLSRKSIPSIYNYMLYQQHNRYIPDFNNYTFIGLANGKLFVVSQSRYSSLLRLDFCLNEKYQWGNINASQVVLARLRDAIMLSGPLNDREECAEFLYSIGNISV